MSYNYQEQKAHIFTEEGQVMFLKVRDKAKHLLKEAGAVRLDKLIGGLTGDSWDMIACVDRLVELGELVEVQNPFSGQWTQHRVFVDVRGVGR